MATGAANLADGITLAAAPLLAASVTRDPVLVSGLVVAQRLPWFVFTLPSGVLVDRYDRRRMMFVANLLRGAALAGLGVSLAVGVEHLSVLYATVFLLGTAETVVDNAALAVLPAIVRKDDLERANGRIFATQSVLNELVGPPAGSALFAVAAVSAFLTGGAAFAIAGALVAFVPTLRHEPDPDAPAMLGAIREGFAWFWQHRLIRTVAIIAGVSNFFSAATLGVLVLVAQERLGLGDAGYVVLLSFAAIGGIAGAALAPRIIDRIGQGPSLVFVDLGLQALGALGVAITTSPAVAAVMLAFGSFAGGIGNVIVITLRQAAVPDELLGRVTSAYRLVGLGALPVGALFGGILARNVGLTAPFYAATIGLVIAAACVSRIVTTSAYQAAVDAGTDPHAQPRVEQ